MNRSHRPCGYCNKYFAFFCFSLVGLFVHTRGFSAEDEYKHILVCVSAEAPQSLHDAAKELVAAPDSAMLLRALRSTEQASGARLEDSTTVLNNLRNNRNYNRLAFNYLVVIGIAGQDPLLEKCDDRTVKIDPEKKFLYSLGYGGHTGDIGWIEVDRNPFEYSQRIKDADFTTLIIKITGNSEAAVLAALHEFRRGLLNGAVETDASAIPEQENETAGEGGALLQGSLDITPPPCLPLQLPGDMELAGWTQVAEDEYRAFYDYDAPRPEKIWRLKYLAPKSLAGVGLGHWNNSPHRKAFGNSVNVIRFSSEDAAESAFKALQNSGVKSKIKARKGDFFGLSALFVPVAEDMCDGDKSAAITIVHKGTYLIFSTLPAASFKAFLVLCP